MTEDRIYLKAGDALINGSGGKIIYTPGCKLGLDPFPDADFRIEIDGVLHDVYYDVDESSDHYGQLFTRTTYIRKKGGANESSYRHRADTIQPVK